MRSHSFSGLNKSALDTVKTAYEEPTYMYKELAVIRN